MDAPVFRQEKVAAPLEGQLYLVPGMDKRFGEEFLQGVFDRLRFDTDASLPIHWAAGRNYTVALPKRLGAYDCLQIAGAGNYDIGIRSNNNIKHGIVTYHGGRAEQAIQPPSENSGLFVSHTTYYEGGKLVDKANTNPVGSYSSHSAKRKINNMVDANHDLRDEDPPVLTPIYIGRYEYDIADQNGDPQTAILMLVPHMGERYDSTLLRPLRYALAHSELPPSFEADFRQRYRDILAKCFSSIGLSIASAHQQGLNHNQPTAGNVAVFKTVDDGSMFPYITDWDTMTRPEPADIPYARALDLTIAVQSNASVIHALVERGHIGESSAEYAFGMTVLGILAGYLKKMGKQPHDILTPDSLAPLINSRLSNKVVIKYIANLATMPDDLRAVVYS